MSLKSILNTAASDKMLYNVTFNLEDHSTVLKPSIPYSASDDYGEDKTTLRVCLSDSIERCISAIGPSFRNLFVGCKLVVRSVRLNDLEPDSLIHYAELYSSGKVPDAMENHEYWYLKDVNVNRVVYEIQSFSYEHAIAYTCLKADDVLAIARKYVSVIPSLYLVSAKELCTYVGKVLWNNKLFDELDSFDEEIAELPWARRVEISNLVLK